MSIEETTELYARVAVAKYLKKRGYEDSLRAFLKESSLPLKDIADENDDKAPIEDLETIIGDRITFAEHLFQDKFKGLTLNDSLDPIDTSKFHVPNWNHSAKFERVNFKIPSDTLTICAKYCGADDSLLLSFADRKVNRYNHEGEVVDHFNFDQRSSGTIKLCGSVPNSNIFYMCGLDGSLTMFDGASNLKSNFSSKLHQRMVTGIQFSLKSSSPGKKSWYVVSCGLDNYLRLHQLTLSNQKFTLEPLSEVKLLSACTSLKVATNNGKLLIFLTRTDYTQVLCYGVDETAHRLLVLYRIALNNAQFTTYSFNVRDMAILGGTDEHGSKQIGEGSMLLVATSHTPYMRLILVDISPLSGLKDETTFYDRVLRNMSTVVEQDSYSEPIMKVLPNGNGVMIGDSRGIYAVDVEKGDSWLLDLPSISKDTRVKCMDINGSGSRLVIAESDKTVLVYDIVV